METTLLYRGSTILCGYKYIYIYRDSIGLCRDYGERTM